jgi:hypothetical protein
MSCAQPCLAADLHEPGGAERRNGAFAGLSLRLPFGGRTAPSARLQLAPVHEVRDVRGVTGRGFGSAGFELGLGPRGAPAYFVGGREIRRTDERLAAGGSTTTWLIVGGVLVVVVLVAAAVANAQPTAGPPKGAFP